MKIQTTILLTIITIVAIFNDCIEAAIILWVMYGIYKYDKYDEEY